MTSILMRHRTFTICGILLLLLTVVIVTSLPDSTPKVPNHGLGQQHQIKDAVAMPASRLTRTNASTGERPDSHREDSAASKSVNRRDPSDVSRIAPSTRDLPEQKGEAKLPPTRRHSSEGDSRTAGQAASAKITSETPIPLLNSEEEAQHEDAPIDEVVTQTYRVPLVYAISDESFGQRFPDVSLGVIDSIRHEFENAVGVDAIPVESPEYAARWKAAEPSALERMRTLFGWAAVAEFEKERHAGEAAAGQ